MNIKRMTAAACADQIGKEHRWARSNHLRETGRGSQAAFEVAASPESAVMLRTLLGFAPDAQDVRLKNQPILPLVEDVNLGDDEVQVRVAVEVTP